MKTPNERFKRIRPALRNMAQNKFAKVSKISISTIQKIETGLMEVSDNTLDLLKDNVNVNPEFIKTGKGEMFIDGTLPDVSFVNEVEDSPWKNEAFQNLKNEVTFYRNLVMQLTGGKAGNFLRTLNETALEATG